jgi:TonB family protein
MRTRKMHGVLAVLLFFPGTIRSQEQSVSATATDSTATYANTKEGLKQLLLDMRTAAKEGNEDKLAAMVKEIMESPNCDKWLHRICDSDKADFWMGLIEPKSGDPRERDMRELFGHIAKQDGKIITRKINDDELPAKGHEWGWLQTIKQPHDIYWASWLQTNELKESEADPIGYFMFDGAFRWESSIQSFKPSQTKVTHAKFVLPKLVKRVAPIYPPAEVSKGISGTVRVHFVIGGDGLVYNAHAISSEGFSEDGLLRKAAEEAVLQWRFQPASRDGKPIQIDWTADINFSQKN